MRGKAGRAKRSISDSKQVEFWGFGSWIGLHHTRSGGNRQVSAVSKGEKDHPAGVGRAQGKRFEEDLKEGVRGQTDTQNSLDNAQVQSHPEVPVALCPGSQLAAIQKCEEKPGVKMFWASLQQGKIFP